MDSLTRETLGPHDRIPAVFSFSRCPFFVVEGKKTNQNIPTWIVEGKANIVGWVFLLVLFCFVLFNTIGVSLNTFCEPQTQTCLGAGFLHSIGPAVAQLENFPNFSKVDLSKADNQALTNNI